MNDGSEPEALEQRWRARPALSPSADLRERTLAALQRELELEQAAQGRRQRLVWPFASAAVLLVLIGMRISLPAGEAPGELTVGRTDRLDPRTCVELGITGIEAERVARLLAGAGVPRVAPVPRWMGPGRPLEENR